MLLFLLKKKKKDSLEYNDLTVQIISSLVFIECSIKYYHFGHIVRRMYILVFLI